MRPTTVLRGRKRCSNCFAYATVWLCADCWRVAFTASPIAFLAGVLGAATLAWWLGACR